MAFARRHLPLVCLLALVALPARSADPPDSRFCVLNVTEAERPLARIARRNGFLSPRALLTLYARHRVSGRSTTSLPSTLDFEPSGLRVEIYDFEDPRYVRRIKEVKGTLARRTFGNCETILEKPPYSIVGIRTTGRADRATALTVAEELAHARFSRDFMGRLIRSENTVLFQNDRARLLFDEFYAKYEAARAIRGATRPNSNILAQIVQNYGGMEPEFAYLFWAAQVMERKPIDELSLDDICRVASGVRARPLDYSVEGRLAFLAFHSSYWISLSTAPWYRFADE